MSIGGFVPKPHTPFQWAPMERPEVIDDRLRMLKQAINSDRSLGRAIGYRYHDGEPSLIEGLLSRGDRRVGAVIRRVWEKGGRFDGWSEHFSYARWVDAAAEVLPAFGVDLDWFTTRERDAARGAALGPPRLRPGQGLALAGLAGLAQRVRAGRLPLDPVLRLRRLPVHGHRDPDRPHRQEAAAAHPG